MLDTRHREKKDLRYIFLYTDPTENMLRAINDGFEDSIEFESIRMHTAQGDDAGLCIGDKPPEKKMMTGRVSSAAL